MEKFKKALNWFLHSYIWIGILILVLDIVSKNLVVKYQANIFAGGGRNGGIDIIPGFLGINYVINPNVAFGASFGNATTNKIVFTLLALTISALIIVLLIKKWGKLKTIYKVVCYMIIAGAIGNAIDRLFYSAEYLNYHGVSGVVDFIDFYGIWKFNFNVADSSVVVAAFMFVIAMIVFDVKESKNKENKNEKIVKKSNDEKLVSKTEQEQENLRNKN
ncbi:MAG: signal peptidase II [Bacilli bacterium]|nr:signal peptidase II [Bacilli bacterium]